MVKLVGYFDNIKGPSSVEHAFFLQRKKPICFQNRVPGYIFLSEALDIFGKYIYENKWTGIEIETSVCFNEQQTNDIIFELDFFKDPQTFSSLKNEFPFLKDKIDDEILFVLKSYSSAHTRFREARQKLRLLLQGELSSFLLEDSGRQFKISETVWAGIYAEEIFKVVGDCDIADTGSDYPYFSDGYEEINYLSTDDLYELLPSGEAREYFGKPREGSVVIKKAQLESILNQEKNDKKTPPQPPSSDMNAETIIKFLETRGHVNPHFKLMLHYVHKGIPEKLSEKDFKKAFKNWIEQNGNTLVPELSKSQINDITDSRLGDISRQIK